MVLGAGGVSGWGIHFGACDALADAGLPLAGASRVIGTSAGAAVAASHLGGVGADEAVEGVLVPPTSRERRAYLERVREHNADRAWWPAAPGLVREALPGGAGIGVAWAGLAPEGAFPGESLTRFPGIDHDRWPAALRIVAVSLDDGDRVVFGPDGRLGASVPDAVRASQSVPLMFAPAVIDGRRYVDGAVWSSTHADLVLEDPPDLAVVVAPMAREGRGIGQRIARSRARRELGLLIEAGVEVVAVRPGPGSEPLFSFSARSEPGHGRRLVDLGRRMVLAGLAARG